MFKINKSILSEKVEVPVRFSEVDVLGIVWHGNYIKYFEDGREAFGRKFGINYLDCKRAGLITPIVGIECNYKLPLSYGDSAVIETRYVACDSAKIIFEYSIYRKSDGEISATGKSTQVFLNENGELILTNPVFYEEWKKKWGLAGL